MATFTADPTPDALHPELSGEVAERTAPEAPTAVEKPAMRHILLITSSPRAGSYSTRVARALAEALLAADPALTLTVRDLSREPLPHIDDSFVTARNLPAAIRTPAQQATLARSDVLLEELFASEVIIIAAAMINFSIPSSLKAYLDHILRPGVAFRYTEKGPEGLVSGKKAYLVVARGGSYSEGPMQAMNFQDPYLRTALGFIGITDVEVIRVEGTAVGPDAGERAVAAALAKVAAIVA